jgi:riboflavin kinase/FMN adenylyltransferase
MPAALLSADQKLEKAWITIGSFDGVHLGHQALISQFIKGAHKDNSPAVVVTFFPHPAVILKGIETPFYLTSPEEKTAILTIMGVDKVITLQFDQELASRTGHSFLGELKQGLGFTSLWVGSDFALGRDREGSISVLQEISRNMDFHLQIVELMKYPGKKISSSDIRRVIQQGDVLAASRMLGRWYSLDGTVIPGDGRGRILGIPTANLKTWPHKLLPQNGVYASLAWHKGRPWKAVVNIGLKPTFHSPGGKVWIEAHLLDFNDDLNGQHIRLDLVSRIRAEKKFITGELLVEQIKQDILTSREVLQNAPTDPNLPAGSPVTGS